MIVLPAGAPPGDRFACTMCGKCCETLQERPGAPEWPAGFDALARQGLYGLATERGLQVWSWERRRLAREAAARGVALRVVPSLVLLDDGPPTGRAIALVHELAHMACPLAVPGPVPDSVVCGAYDARPLVCRAFPVVVRQGSAAYSVKCPSAFLPTGPDRDGYLATFGSSFAAGEASLSVTREVRRLLDFLETAGALRLRRGASREEAARRVARGPVVDFWDALDESGAVDAREWLARVRGTGEAFTPEA